MTINIHSRGAYPASELSNFASHSFTFNNVACRSMEGLLQSLKFKDPEQQKNVCQMEGKAAKEYGLSVDWRKTQTLWWQGTAMARHGQAYQSFLDNAFHALYSQNADAKKALMDTGKQHIIHSIGVIDPAETVLTEKEFCDRLLKLRAAFL